MADEVIKRDVNRTTVAAGVTSDGNLDILQLRMNTTSKRQEVDADTELQGYDSIGEGLKSVATAGTAVQLASNSCQKVLVQAMDDNVGVVVVGSSSVVAAVGTRQGLALFPSQAQIFEVSNTNLLYIDAASGGDGDTVTFTFFS